jgi:heat shock protein HtpX
MADTPCPVLTYDRIDANKRRTRLLLVSFAVMLLPVVSAITVYVMPWVFLFGVAGYQLLWAPAPPAPNAQLPAWAWMLEAGIIVIALIITVVALTGATLFLILRYGSRALLRIAHATPLDRDTDREIVRVIENLCIGAGLPLPSLHVIESPAPNAFAIGRDPEHASLVLTRGLVTLLDRRELEGVIAHELAHIGNHDIALSTTLAALVGTLNMPFRIFSAIFRGVFSLPLGFRIVAGIAGLQLVLSIGATYVDGLRELMDPNEWTEFPPLLRWWGLHAMLAPAYCMFVAPVLALVVRQAISREREFLSDADAVLLTRDPEGLALALVKVTTATGPRLRVGEGSVHLYFADPVADGSLIHRLFPSHPPVERRIELLARMGSGISPADLRRAEAAGAEAAAKIASVSAAVKATVAEQMSAMSAMSAGEQSADTRQIDERPPKPAGTTPLYEQPDGWSRVLEQLSPGADVRPIRRQGDFIRVLANGGLTGYVASSARLPAIVAFNAKGLS